MGKKMPQWVEQGWQEYHRRMPAHVALKLTEISPVHRSGAQSADSARQQEGQRILERIGENSHLLLLDEKGKDLSTTEWSKALEQMMQNALRPVFVIGGADGVSGQVKARADRVWRLSRLTFPHPLVRVILAEQLYRAFMLLQNHPYHRA